MYSISTRNLVTDELVNLPSVILFYMLRANLCYFLKEKIHILTLHRKCFINIIKAILTIVLCVIYKK